MGQWSRSDLARLPRSRATTSHDLGVAAVILGAGQGEAVAEVVHQLGFDARAPIRLLPPVRDGRPNRRHSSAGRNFRRPVTNINGPALRVLRLKFEGLKDGTHFSPQAPRHGGPCPSQFAPFALSTYA
jgi:hypothetical protein